ncbi:MAG: Fe(2+)-trafficking protein [Phycisphaerales bacterium]|nr:Fe(2+)-trafficking protein [Phycisphaerales bacterium]
MATIEERIAQFENMAEADPENEMAHFSLGSAYLQAGRAAEAAVSLERCTDLNREMSKAWQLRGQALIDAGWSDQAVAVLQEGYEIAAGKGDLLPRDAMADLLRSIGREPPELSEDVEKRAQAAASSGSFICQQTGRPGTKMDGPPFRGAVGEWIAEHITVETWQEWVGQGTKVINELRLDLSRDEDSATYDQHMCEFLGVPGDIASTA